MSIYATMWEIHVDPGGYCEDDGWSTPEPGEGCHCAQVYAQGVPAHLDMTGEIWDDWLPPPVEDRDGNLRAVFICGPLTEKGTKRNGQEYTDPLVVLPGDEYESITWEDMLARITEALGKQYHAAAQAAMKGERR